MQSKIENYITEDYDFDKVNTEEVIKFVAKDTNDSGVEEIKTFLVGKKELSIYPKHNV